MSSFYNLAYPDDNDPLELSARPPLSPIDYEERIGNEEEPYA